MATTRRSICGCGPKLTADERGPLNKFRFSTVTAVVIANMVGTGVFTSLGFQLLEIRSGFVLLMLWLVGGIVAFCGAMTYAELGAALPRSGGEYNFLGRIYHPAVGFVSGWISATIGFAAPTALAAITFAAYASSSFPGEATDWQLKGLACALVILLTVVHASNRRNSGGLQLGFTLIKVAVIVAFCGGALLAVDTPEPLRILPAEDDGALLVSGAFAVALIYVNYAYTGWNAATYLSSEIDNPQRHLPRILFTGTVVVAVLYLALNYVFLRVAPMEAMAGQVEVGFIAADAAFGELGGRLTGLVLALLLVSTVSAMTLAGPRVLQVIGEDFDALRLLSRTNKAGIPAIAIVLQSTLALVFILTSSFESILVFAGFTLGLSSFATVLGVYVLRRRQPELARPYRTVGYPLTPLVYLAISGWTLYFVTLNKPTEALAGLGIVASGLLFYFLSAAFNRRRR